MSSIQRSALVPYSDREMFALVADIASYPSFLPWCGGARIVSQEHQVVMAEIAIAYKGVHKTFITRNLLQQDKGMEMHLVEGPFRYLHGYWRFTPLEGRACKIALDLEFEVENRLLAVVLTPVFTSIVTDLVEGFRRRAQDLYGART